MISVKQKKSFVKFKYFSTLTLDGDCFLSVAFIGVNSIHHPHILTFKATTLSRIKAAMITSLN
jgi:hypothetical protein